MKTFAALIAALAFATSANAALPVGAKAPNFTTPAALAGNSYTFSLSKALRRGPVVLYFFPAAFTKGCTIEAHEFALASAEYAKNGATLIGLTAGNTDRIAEFSKVECREAFPVGIASADVIKAYDVILPQKNTLSDRTSFVIAPSGKIIFALTRPQPDGHVEGTMKAVKAWKASPQDVTAPPPLPTDEVQIRQAKQRGDDFGRGHPLPIAAALALALVEPCPAARGR